MKNSKVLIAEKLQEMTLLGRVLYYLGVTRIKVMSNEQGEKQAYVMPISLWNPLSWVIALMVVVGTILWTGFMESRKEIKSLFSFQEM